jgi:hypothetical protein
MRTSPLFKKAANPSVMLSLWQVHAIDFALEVGIAARR